MSQTVGIHLVNQFSSEVQHLSQQKASRLAPAVRMEPLRGEWGFFDQIGAVDMVERTSRHADTPFTEIPHTRRAVFMRDFEASEIVDDQDKLRMINDPTNFYVQAFAAAAGRRMDDTIIAAAFAAARTGKTGETTVNFPAGNTIAHDFVETGSAATSGMTIAKLRRAKEILDAAEAGTDPDEERYIACSAREITNLLRTTEVTSSDFNTVQALVAGKLDTFMGFKFLRTERLLLNGSSHRRCIAWVKSGLLLAVGMQPTGEVGKDPGKGFNIRVYYKTTLGATRMEEPKVVEIVCNPAA